MTITKAPITYNYAQFEAYIQQYEKADFQHIANYHLVTNCKSDFVMKSKIDGSINPYWEEIKNGTIVKEQWKRCILINDYHKRVINNASKEGIYEEFTPKEMTGRKHISDCVLTDTKTETLRYVYLEYFEGIKDKKPQYLRNGEVMDFELLRNWYDNTPNTAPSQLGQKKKVFVFTPLFTSVVDVKMEGEHIVLQHS